MANAAGILHDARQVNRLPISPLVARAIEIAEKHLGLREISARVGVPEIVVQAWRFGHAEIPNAKFLLLVDLLTTLDPQWSKPAAGDPTAAKRILIVDDHPDLADSLAALLTLDGHEAIAVVDPRGALDAAKALKPNVAMLDLRMPHIDGLQLARLIRSEAELEHTRLVAITAETGQVFELMRQVGFVALLKKPVDLAIMRAIVAHFAS